MMDRHGFEMEEDEKKVAMLQDGCTSDETFLKQVSGSMKKDSSGYSYNKFGSSIILTDTTYPMTFQS